MNRREFVLGGLTLPLGSLRPRTRGRTLSQRWRRVAVLGACYTGVAVADALAKTASIWLDAARTELCAYAPVPEHVLARHAALIGQFGPVPRDMFRSSEHLEWIAREVANADSCYVLASIGYGQEFDFRVLHALVTALGRCARQAIVAVLTPARVRQYWLESQGLRHVQSMIARINGLPATTILLPEPTTRALTRLMSLAPNAPVTPDVSADISAALRASRDTLAAPIVRALGKVGRRDFRPFQVFKVAGRVITG